MKAIQSFLAYRPNDDYIINQSHLPWLNLDLNVPIDEIYKEFLIVKDEFVEHRASDRLYNLTNHLWSSLTIFGASAKVTTESDQKYDWTDIAVKCPITKQWILDNFVIDESTGRIRFMLLGPNGYILPHSDRNESKLSEVNVAITHPDGCIFRFLDRGDIPFKPGLAFMIDTSNRHMVVNKSDKERLHIILHAKLKNNIVKRSYENSFYNK